MFSEERLDLTAGYGATVTPEFEVDIIEVANGDEYRDLKHPYPRDMIELNFPNRTEAEIMDTLLDLFKRSGGKFGGFRFKNWLDYTSNGRKGAPTYNDQACSELGAGVYQLVKWYGTEGSSTATRRRVRKPVAGTVLVGIRDEAGNPHQVGATGPSPERWAVDTTTGQISFSANIQNSITDITQAAQAVITVGSSHGLVAEDSVHISGVAGMTEINGLRGLVLSVTSTTITVDIDSTAFTAFALSSPNAAVANTRPQTGETVTAGFEYDLPVRFLTNIPAEFTTRNPENAIMSAPVSLIEILNPDS